MANDITVIRDFLEPGDSTRTTLHAGSDGIVLGRWDGGPEHDEQPCEVILNDPTVSRIHASVIKIDDEFYIINLSTANVVRLNTRWIKQEESGILADGDTVQIGPYYLAVTRKGRELALRVTAKPQTGRAEQSMSASISMDDLMKERAAAQAAPPPSSQAMQGVINVFWERRKKREKAARPSPLHPRTQAKPGKVRWNWTPTRDLARPWPFSVFIWATALVAVFGVVSALVFANVFSPAPLSNPHQRNEFKLASDGKIANKPNSNSCLTCHAILGTKSVDDKCSECHQADGFHASNTKKHIEAGITCTVCHQEHQGANYQPKQDSFDSCARCHNDANPQLYNGKSVSTPHKATYGYPVRLNKWIWMGLDKEVLEQKPEVVQILNRYRTTHQKEPGQTDEDLRQQELNWQFHAIHLYRVKAAPGVVGVENGTLSCSSCHKTTYPNLDRNYPIEVCAKCHNGYYDEQTKELRVAKDKPNCTSCHVQHYFDKYRWSDLLIDKARDERLKSIDDKAVESIVKPSK
jgi:hypothetical protein